MLKSSFTNATVFGAAAIGSVAIGVIAWRAVTAVPPSPAIQEPPRLEAARAPVPPATPGELPVSKPQLPEFDVVRVEPSGDAVVAGRAPAQSVVTLYNRETKLSESKADANGQFVIIPPPLPPGDHLLTLRAVGPLGSVASEQSVTVAVAAKTGETNIAALAIPGKPTVIISQPPKATPPGATPPPVAIHTVEAGDEGAFYATGVAPPNASLRLYLNGSPVAGVQASPDGKWALKIEHGMAPGHYEVRADALDASSGKVTARAEVPFDYPAARVAANSAAPPTAARASAPQTAAVRPPGPSAPGATGAPAIVATPPVSTGAPPASDTGVAVISEVNSVTVTRGDNLWRISRKVLGKGSRYTQIYEANASQIRDPDRIWPGQIFVAPQTLAR